MLNAVLPLLNPDFVHPLPRASRPHPTPLPSFPGYTSPSWFCPSFGPRLGDDLRLGGRPDLVEDAALLEPPLLLEPHDLEAVEVREALSALHLLPALEPVGLLPLGVDLVLLP